MVLTPKGIWKSLCPFVLFCFVLCLFCFTSNNDSGTQFAFSGFTDAKKTLHHHTPLRDSELEHQAFHPLEHFTTGLERIGEGIGFFTLHLNKNKHNLTKSECPEEKTFKRIGISEFLLKMGSRSIRENRKKKKIPAGYHMGWGVFQEDQ